MAVYVVLAFEDEGEAKEMVQEIVKGGVVMVPGKYPDETLAMGDAKVYGVWKKPTKFCECISAGKRDGGYARSKNYGWWVHAACGRPTKAWSQGEYFHIDMGTNLLPREVHPNGKDFVTKFRSEAEWSFLVDKG